MNRWVAWRAFALAAACSISAAAQAGGLGPIPQWIWAHSFPRANERVVFTRQFDAPAGVKKAELRGLADARMRVQLNGREVGNIAGTTRYGILDLSSDLRAGKNELVLHAENAQGAGGVLARVDLELADGTRTKLVTDSSWQASEADSATITAVSLGQLGVQPWAEPQGERGDYYQWKLAKGAAEAASVAAMPGFKVELVRNSQPGEGSWVSLARDPQGRLFIGREGPGILRYTLPREGQPERMEVVNDKLLECRGLLWAYDCLYANANNSKGLYRLRDSDGDGTLDDVKLLKATPGGVGHGRNDLALGPDGFLYLIHGNDVRLPDDFQTADSPLRNYGNDRILPCSWDPYLFDAKATLPAGHVIRTDRDGTIWELVAGGFRNPYGIDFNADGEMFTFDADNEGDLGLPWYRSTRVNHIVSGGDYGWRQGSANRPAYFAEHPAPNLDIGKSSPTAVKFGTHSRFPPRYQRALFMLDWSYGRILAVHLTPKGASYSATAETVIEGRPLNVTDLEFGADGAMYFVTGGRGTQSALYRVSWVGPEEKNEPLPPEAMARLKQAAEARDLRKRLERYHRLVDPKAIDECWPHLGSPDPWLRNAARVALERQPVERWAQKTFAEHPGLAEATKRLALARVGSSADQQTLIDGLLNSSRNSSPSIEESLTEQRSLAVSLARMGMPRKHVADSIRESLERRFPSGVPPLNRLDAELLVALESDKVAAKTIPLLTAATSQEDRLYWLYILRNVRQGWTPELRREYFRALASAGQFDGGRDVTTSVFSIRVEAMAAAPTEERAKLAALLADEPTGPTNTAEALPPRPFVRAWQVSDLTGELAGGAAGRDFNRGRALFTTAMCNRCHRFGGAGTPIGPELSAVGHRFGRKDLLETILVPSKVIDDKYRGVALETTLGKVLVGRIVSGDDATILLSTNPVSFDQLERVAKRDIESQTPSPVSPMPVGLLNTLSAAEILDLLAYLESGGDAEHPAFRK